MSAASVATQSHPIKGWVASMPGLLGSSASSIQVMPCHSACLCSAGRAAKGAQGRVSAFPARGEGWRSPPLFSDTPEWGTIWGVVPGPLVRAVRAALFAVVCVGVSAGVHSAAGGCPLEVRSGAVGLPAIAVLAYLGLGRERRGPTLTVGLGAAQVGLHYLFDAMSNAGPSAAPSAMTAMPPMPGMSATMVMPTPGATHPSTTAMLLAHAIAVVVCGWWLRRGERDFFALSRTAAILAAEPLHRLLAVAALLASALTTPALSSRKANACHRASHRPTASPLLSSLTFRGPPVAA
jgi:hypothetical protein